MYELKEKTPEELLTEYLRACDRYIKASEEKVLAERIMSEASRRLNFKETNYFSTFHSTGFIGLGVKN